MNGLGLVAVFVGGGLGSLCRYALSLMLVRTSEQAFPWATLTANVLSCLVMGLGIYYFSDRLATGTWQRLFLLVGFCGGFSTFSTFSLENFQLLRSGSFVILGLNILLSLVLCVAVFYVLQKCFE